MLVYSFIEGDDKNECTSNNKYNDISSQSIHSRLLQIYLSVFSYIIPYDLQGIGNKIEKEINSHSQCDVHYPQRKRNYRLSKYSSK